MQPLETNPQPISDLFVRLDDRPPRSPGTRHRAAATGLERFDLGRPRPLEKRTLSTTVPARRDGVRGTRRPRLTLSRRHFSAREHPLGQLPTPRFPDSNDYQLNNGQSRPTHHYLAGNCWHIHHLLWRSKGGSDSIENLVLLHPNCHRQVHSEGLVVNKTASREGRS